MPTDSQLQQDVLAELRWEPGVNAAHIGITVKEGVVTLTGHVSSYGEKHAAEKAVKRVYGVKAVANELDVKLPGDKQRSDQDIAAACRKALEWNLLVPGDSIRITVTSGWVILEGEVNWQFQRMLAEQTIRFVTGVKGISNQIKIKPRVRPDVIASRIEDALRRSAEQQANQIRVELQDGKVILRGTVRSLAESEDAERIAWSSPGVTQVENYLVVEP